MPYRDHEAVANRAQQLASSGDYEGFNAMTETLTKEFGAMAVEILKRDPELKRHFTELCQAAWARKRS